MVGVLVDSSWLRYYPSVTPQKPPGERQTEKSINTRGPKGREPRELPCVPIGLVSQSILCSSGVASRAHFGKHNLLLVGGPTI